MVRSNKSKRVSWASDVNLCQIRLFLSEDAPSQVGVGAQDNLQVKASWLLHSTGVGFDDQLPPGFEGAHATVHSQKELSDIPCVKWQCPPRFIQNPYWHMVNGEESEEAEVQKQREMRTLEAIYPRHTTIPSSPSVSLEIENSHDEDQNTPLIPITPIEEEDVNSQQSDLVVPTNNPMSPQAVPVSFGQGIQHKPQNNTLASPKPLNANGESAVGFVPGVEPDVVAAASAAFTAIMRSNEQGSLIDQELLIKILSNPKLIEKLVMDYGTAANPPPSSSSVKLSGTPPSDINRVVPTTSLSAPYTSGLFHPATNAITHARVPAPTPTPTPTLTPTPASVPPTPPPPPPTLHPSLPLGIAQNHSPALKPPPVKDVNYYKSLIQLHGGEKAEAQELTLPPQYAHHHHLGSKADQLQSSNLGISKGKNKRPCIYFNSSRGCKHGAKCTFPHDMSIQQRSGSPHDMSIQQRSGSMPEAQSVKRMKVDREITGRT